MFCEVCGSEFTPSRKLHYLIKRKGVGYQSPFIMNATDDGRALDTLYDCFECPVCGGQAFVKARIGFEYLSEDGLIETFVDPEDVEKEINESEKDNPSRYSLFFFNEDDAVVFLDGLKKLVKENGFLSYSEYKGKYGGPLNWEKEFGWDNLDKAIVCQGGNGWYIVMPSMRRRKDRG